MLIVAGSITTEDGGRDAFLTAVAPMVAATHTEPGCREYVFSPTPTTPTASCCSSCGTTRRRSTPTSRASTWPSSSEQMADVPIAGREIKKYTISDVGPVR